MFEGQGIGERELINRISEILGGLDNDDCAIIDAGERYLVATTDMLHRTTDFPEIMNPWQIGWMSVAVNLSDVAAMGAVPVGVLIATGLPRDSDSYFIDELFSGFRDCAELYGTKVLGGDTDDHFELTITGCAFGMVEKDLVLRRRGAHLGDLLCTTGCLGGAGGGLWAWKHGDQKSKLIKRLLEPEPRLEEGRALAVSRTATAMMDNSDGLALSLFDLSRVNKIGFEIYEKSLPIIDGLSKEVGYEEAIHIVMSSGGDFELLFTVRPDVIDLAKKACKLTVIGKVVEQGIWLINEGQKTKVLPNGYEHKIGKLR